MSYADGWAALHLEMPPRVPRTEYSADVHWPLIKAVTGMEANPQSSPERQNEARQAFMRAWNFDFLWCTLIYNQIFGDLRTQMGHGEYLADGSDLNRERATPFKNVEEVLDFDPWAAYGTIDQRSVTRDFEANWRALRAFAPEVVPTTGIYVTCISGLIEIFGWQWLLMGLGLDPVAFGTMTNRYASWIQQYFDALAAADVPVVMIHDDIVWTSGPFCSPDWYRQFVFPNYRRYFAPLRESGKIILYTSDGNYTEFIDDIAASGVHGFVMEPATDMALIAERYGKTHSFIGNADTRILLHGTRAEIRSEVERCMRIGKRCPGFIMAVGNHIPANTPVENALYYNEVYEELSKR